MASARVPRRSPREGAPLLPLLIAVFLSSFDRLSMAPLILPMAAEYGSSVELIVQVVTVYLVGYGLMQVVWGMVSNRIGRVRTMKTALWLAVLGSVATALAPNVPVLLLGRLVAGAAFAAIVPSALIYVGDTVPIQHRHAPLTDVMASTAIGMAVGTLGAAALADAASWRVVFAVTAAASVLTALYVARLPEPEAGVRTPGAWRPLLEVLRSRWALVVLALAFTEGVVLLGVLNILPTVLQLQGMTTTTSGLVTASYGVAIIVFSRLVKTLARTWSLPGLIAVGGSSGVAAYAVMSVTHGVVGVLVGAVFLAGAWAFMHSSMQKWATDVVPSARAATISLFASLLFLGASVGTAIGTPFTESGEFGPYFLGGLATTIALLLVATLTSARHAR